MTGPPDVPPRIPIEDRLRAAGLPPLPRMAWLELDLDALVDNLAVLRDLAGPETPLYPVVKADAYGHGAAPIARALEDAGADGFCVATMDEAMALRAAGISRPIRVLYPVPTTELASAAELHIAVAVGEPETLAATLDAANLLRPGLPPLDLEVEVETGLGRGGMLPADVVAAVARIDATPAVRLVGLWTHLQASEDEARTATQLARFEAVRAALEADGSSVPTRHLPASGGLLTEVATFEGARPGLLVYGLVPDELDEARLDPAVVGRFRPVLSLHARPVRVIDLPAGHGIGYGPTFTTTRPSRIATLPVGYADGYSRALSNRAEALVRGWRVPLVGNVAMDAVMADVTDVPGAPVSTDDEVTLIGRQGDQRISVGDLARWRTTNRWEVVSGMARRLPRVYDAPSAPVGVRTLTVETTWPASSFGTATSATSRSMRS